MAQVRARPPEAFTASGRDDVGDWRGDALHAHLAVQEFRRARAASRKGNCRRSLAAAGRSGPFVVAASGYLSSCGFLTDDVAKLLTSSRHYGVARGAHYSP